MKGRVTLLLATLFCAGCGTSKLSFAPPPPPTPDARAPEDGGTLFTEDATPPPTCTRSAPFAATLPPLDLFFVIGMPELYSLGGHSPNSGSVLTPLLTSSVFTNAQATLVAYPNISSGYLTTTCWYQSYTTGLYPWNALPAQAGELEGEVTDAYNAYFNLGVVSGGGGYIDDVPSGALKGALLQATAWKSAHTDHFVAVVLVTDVPTPLCTNAFPQDQGPQGMQVLAAEANGYGVVTFVGATAPADALVLRPVGVAGGGTTVDLSAGSGFATLETAIEKARQDSVLCDFTIPSPDGGTFDPKEVNVEANQAVVSQVQSAAACPNAGRAWYYDSNTNPKHILLCPALCAEVQQNAVLSIDVLFGCPTIGAGQ
jgi:hypothetical protein